jgi:hypothetical protein
MLPLIAIPIPIPIPRPSTREDSNAAIIEITPQKL